MALKKAHVEKARRLTNLLLRGRRLHYENAQVLVARAAGARLPHQVPATVDLVYRGVQLLFALTFLDERGYLAEADYDPFTDRLFAEVARAEGPRLHGLVQSYAQSLPDPDQLGAVVGRDLSAALVGQVHPALVQALAGQPRAIQRTTHLYCAMTFDDRAMVAQLS